MRCEPEELPYCKAALKSHQSSRLKVNVASIIPDPSKITVTAADGAGLVMIIEVQEILKTCIVTKYRVCMDRKDLMI
ncbi:hypothetical protein V6N13_058988 [Hibiscus sabdariffa]